jgi:hypothetical protein
MSIAIQNTPALNGLNGTSVQQKKVKSKNQLRRQKAKQKKATPQVRTFPTSQLAYLPTLWKGHSRSIGGEGA